VTMPPRHVARLLAGAIVCLAGVGWLDSPLRPSASRRLQMLAVAPQFWGYFVLPRAEQIEVFRRSNGAWARADAPFAAPENLFGLRRATVNYGAEFRTLLDQVTGSWTTASLTPQQLPETSADALSVRNLARRPRLCGDVLLVSRPPVPWAWARASSRAALPTRFARLDIAC